MHSLSRYIRASRDMMSVGYWKTLQRFPELMHCAKSNIRACHILPNCPCFLAENFIPIAFMISKSILSTSTLPGQPAGLQVVSSPSPGLCPSRGPRGVCPCWSCVDLVICHYLHGHIMASDPSASQQDVVISNSRQSGEKICPDVSVLSNLRTASPCWIP